MLHTAYSIPNVKLNSLTLSGPEKLKNLISVIPIIPQTLNINNQRITSAKSINLDIIRKPIPYSLKTAPGKAIFVLTAFEILLFESRLLLTASEWGKGNKRVKVLVKN